MKFFSTLFLILFLGVTAFNCKESAEIDPRDQLVGSYNMAQICTDQTGDSLRYQVTLSKSADIANRMRVNNFGSYGQDNFLFIEVASDHSISIPSQEIPVGLAGNATIDGTGEWSNNVLLFDFGVFISGIVDTQCQSQGSKL